MQQCLWSVSMAASKPTRRSQKDADALAEVLSGKPAVTDCRMQKGRDAFASARCSEVRK